MKKAQHNWQVPFLEALSTLRPHFQRYVNIQGGIGQLVQFMAVVAGIKPVLDDWVAAYRLDHYFQLLADLGLKYRVESFFDFIEAGKTGDIIGGDKLNTTRAYGHSPTLKTPTGFAHVFLAKNEELLTKAIPSGWYSLVVDGRVLDKPYIDHHLFGEYLGYPPCCRRFFAHYNDWNSKNSYYQTYRATSSPSFLCNTLMKHSGLSYAVHIPCSFCCQATMDYACQVRSFIANESKALTDLVDRILKWPYLILSEWEMYGLMGEVVARDRVNYRDVFVVPTNQPDLTLYRALEAGNAVEVERDVIRIYRDSKVHTTYRTRSDRFGPQVPFFVNFEKG